MTKDEFNSCIEKLKPLFSHDAEGLDVIIDQMEVVYSWASKQKERGFGINGIKDAASTTPGDASLFLISLLASVSEAAVLGLKQEQLIRSSFTRLVKERKSLIEKALVKTKLEDSGRIGGKSHHKVEREGFIKRYKTERNTNPGKPRSTIVDELNGTGAWRDIATTTLSGWAKSADKDDCFVRKGGRPTNGVVNPV